MMGRRNDKVLPEPVWAWMNASRGFEESDGAVRRAGRAARWMDVGRVMESRVLRWAVRSGSRPRPEKEEVSRGALLGLEGVTA